MDQKTIMVESLVYHIVRILQQLIIKQNENVHVFQDIYELYEQLVHHYKAKVEKKIVLLVKEHLTEANVYIIHVEVNVFELLLDHNHYHQPIFRKNITVHEFCFLYLK
jgi:hypothetical protein